jgi:hypothetical protein
LRRREGGLQPTAEQHDERRNDGCPQPIRVVAGSGARYK